MNLGTRFRISLKNSVIYIDLLLDLREYKRRKRVRKRENRMRKESEKIK